MSAGWFFCSFSLIMLLWTMGWFTFLLCLQRKYLKHQAFENEVNGRAEQVEGVINLGKSLIERRVCDGDEENMQVKSVLR